MAAEDDIDTRTGKILYGFVEEFLGSSTSKIKDFFKKNKFGLLPQGSDYSELDKNIKSKKQLIGQIKYLIGKPKTLPALLCGIHLNCLNQDERQKQYSECKDLVYKKHGREGLVVFNMGVTGFINAYVKLLTEESIEENLSQKERVDNFEEIVKDWEERSFFVDSNKTERGITKTCRRRMEFGKSLFFIFAAGRETKKANESIKIIIKNKIDKDFGYDIRKFPLNSKKTELVWFFRKKSILELK